MLVSDGTGISTRIHSLFFSSSTTMSGLFACMFLSVCIGLSYSTVSSSFFITGRISCSYHLLLTSNPCVLHIVQWMNLATLLWRSRYSCFASIGHPETMCDIVSG